MRMMVVVTSGPLAIPRRDMECSPPPKHPGVLLGGRFRVGGSLGDGGEPHQWDGAFLVAMVTQLVEPGPPVAMGTAQPG